VLLGVRGFGVNWFALTLALSLIRVVEKFHSRTNAEFIPSPFKIKGEFFMGLRPTPAGMKMGHLQKGASARFTVAAGLRAGVLFLLSCANASSRTPARKPAATVIAAALKMASIFRAGIKGAFG
jgi:hypothetical protein